MKYNILKYLMINMIIAMLFFTSSCKKFVQIGAPPTSVSTSTAFKNDATALSAILGLYGGSFMAASGSIENSFMGAITVLGGASADDIYYSAGTYLDVFKDNALTSDNGYVSNLWTFGYTELYNINSAIEGLNSSTGVSATTKSQLLGESYFLRAFTNFYLTNYFGAIPINTTTNVSLNASLGRTPRNVVYDSVIADLKQAVNLLTDDYPSALRARVNKDAAEAMMAKVYLYQKDYQDAETYATTVINNSTYRLVPLDSTFLNSSSEVIWQIYTYYGYSQFGLTFIPAGPGTVPNYVLYPSLVNSFESADNRKAKWLVPDTIGNQVYYYPYKYKIRTSTGGNEYCVVLRLAELYLIRAEARANLNKITGTGSASEDLNMIRTRAGLSNTTAATQNAMLSAIASERAHELFSEYANRWFDLIRTGAADSVLAPLKSGWASTDTLYPVPAAQIQINPALAPQNPGYE